MVSVKEIRCLGLVLLIGVVLNIINLLLQWTYTEYPIRFSKSKYFEQLDLNNDDPFVGSEFKGRILSCMSGCSNSFQLECDDWCKISNHLNEICPGCIERNNTLSLCKLFRNKAISGKLFVGFISCFMFFQFIYGLILLFSHNCNFIHRPCCKQIIQFGCGMGTFLALVFYFATYGAFGGVFSIANNCKEFPTDGTVLLVCASYGTYFALGCLIYYSLLCLWALSISCREACKKAPKNLRLNAEIQNTGHQQYPISEYAMPVVYESDPNDDRCESVYESSSDPEYSLSRKNK